VQSYYYLITRAGTTGVVIASRPFKNLEVSVLVIESGPDVCNDDVVTSGKFSISKYNTSIN
jgi:hypothetical protein